MSEIADFLRARYAERRALAEAATPGPWEGVVDHHQRGEVNASVWSDKLGYYITEHISSGDRHEADAQHIAANDPAAVIADLDAKLRILDEVVPGIDAMEDRIDGEWGAGDPAERESMRPCSASLRNRSPGTATTRVGSGRREPRLATSATRVADIRLVSIWCAQLDLPVFEGRRRAALFAFQGVNECPRSSFPKTLPPIGPDGPPPPSAAGQPKAG